MKKIIFFMAIVILTIAGISSCFAETDDSRYAMGVKAGTLGAGIEGIAFINSNFDARLGINAFEYDYSATKDDVKYDLGLNLLSASLLLDWYPFKGGFRISGGALINENKLDLTAQSQGTYLIGGTSYSSAQTGSLTGDLDFNEIGPYLGIGFGRPFGKKGNWGLSLDIGAVYQGEPNVTLASSGGTLSGNAAFQADIEREKDNLKESIDDYKYYPVVSLALTYKF